MFAEFPDPPGVEYPKKFVRYENLVDELSDAWAFVMAHVDEFGSPNIEIGGELGCWNLDEDDETMSIKYRVGVFGFVEGGWPQDADLRSV